MRVDLAHLDQLWRVLPLQCWASYKASFYCTACSGDFPVTSSGSHSFMILLFSNQYLLEAGNYGSKWINLLVVKAQLVLSWIRPEFCSDLWSSYQLLFYFPLPNWVVHSCYICDICDELRQELMNGFRAALTLVCIWYRFPQRWRLVISNGTGGRLCFLVLSDST